MIAESDFDNADRPKRRSTLETFALGQGRFGDQSFGERP
jgi:hypothetical protein